MEKNIKSKIKKIEAEKISEEKTKDVKASLKYVRVSPYKLRKVADKIRNMSAKEADMVLKLMPQKSSFILKKLLESCVANAKNNFNLDEARLHIIELIVNEGPKFKRAVPRARGRSFRILKPTSHVKILLNSKGEINGPTS